MATFPSLPITLDNYTEMPQDRVVRSNMDVGPQKVRRRSSAQIRPVQMTLFLNDTQLQTLDDFFLANDALVFDFTDPRTGDAQRARFTERPNYSRNQSMWVCTVKIEYMP